MKIKNTISFLVITFGLLFSIHGNAQACAGSQITLSIENITATANTLEYDVYINNTGTADQRLSGYNGDVIYQDGLLPAGATGTIEVVTQPSDGNFPTLNDIIPHHDPTRKTLRWTQAILAAAGGTNVQPFLPHDVPLKFARFRFTSSIPWDIDTESFLSFPLSTAGAIPENNIISICDQNIVNWHLTHTQGYLVLLNDAPSAHFSVFRLLSTETVELNDSMTAFPNPFDASFKLNADWTSEELITIKVYDMTGKQVENRQVKASDISKQEFGNHYQSGIYNVVVSKENSQQTLRVIKK